MPQFILFYMSINFHWYETIMTRSFGKKIDSAPLQTMGLNVEQLNPSMLA